MIKFPMLNLVRVGRCDFMNKDGFDKSSDLQSEKAILSPSTSLRSPERFTPKSFNDIIKSHFFKLWDINKDVGQKNSNTREK